MLNIRPPTPTPMLVDSLRLTVIVILILSIVPTPFLAWQEDVRPKLYVQLGEEPVQRFVGNNSAKDYFKLLHRDGNSILVGARNIVYNLSLWNLSENIEQRLEWHPSESNRELCILKGKSEDDCQNYIRVLAKPGEQKLLVCGTNAYKPMCRKYRQLQGYSYEREDEWNGQGVCPYAPEHNSTAVAVDGELFVATVADFSATDPLIYRSPLRTEQYDLKHLNAPDFVNAMDVGDYVFFFFRETAVEYINCGKTVYSRVARVCRSDKGAHKVRQRWTSFLKARLNCSVAGEFPFYFNEIQSTTELVEGEYGGERAKLLYGVFTTPTNSIAGSAVCAFRLQDILDTFEGPFKEQETMNSNWLPVPPHRVPDPSPGQCVNDTKSLPDSTLNFIKLHPLMDEAVPAFLSSPLLIRTSLQYRFTQIAVDPQVRTVDGKAYDVLFIGTDNGKVLKLVNAEAGESNGASRPALVEELQLFAANVAVKNLRVVRLRGRSASNDIAKLVAVSDDEIVAIGLHRCNKESITSCSECVALQDPYCAWDPKRLKCVAVGSPHLSPLSVEGFVQSVAKGEHRACPGVDTTVPPTTSTTTTTPMPSTSTTTQTTSEIPPPTCPPCVCPSLGNIVKDEENEVQAQASISSISSPGQSSSVPREMSGNIVPQIPASPNEVIIEVNQAPPSQEGGNQPETINSGPKLEASQESPRVYTAETLSIAVSVACIAALVVGFISGFLFSRKCRQDEYASAYSDPPSFLEQHTRLNRLQEPTIMNGPDGYLTSANNKNINLVLNMPQKNTTKNATNTLQCNTGDTKTLSQTPKVKKIYL